MLSYLLYDPKLKDQIRTETANAISDDTVEVTRLMDHCPKLEALFFEVLRMSTASASVRSIISPTKIGSKTLRPGNRLLIPYRQLHYNEEVFGEDVNDFNGQRFLRNKDLTHHPSYRPFGGGATFCPGRFIARQEVNIFIALVLHRFDIELAKKVEKNASGGNGRLQQGFPRSEDSTPCLGIMGPVQGEDVIVNVMPRSVD